MIIIIINNKNRFFFCVQFIKYPINKEFKANSFTKCCQKWNGSHKSEESIHKYEINIHLIQFGN